MRLILATAAALTLLLGVASAPASAATTLTVTTTADDAGGHCPALPVQACSLRAAIATNAADGGGDTVVLPPGRYGLGSVLSVTRAITIEGTGTREQTIIDAAGHAGALLINLTKQARTDATLERLTVTGSSGEPAIIAFDLDPLLLDDVVVRANHADGDLGGGLSLAAGDTVRIANSLFAFNSAGGGGAIAVAVTNRRQSLEIDNSELRGNAAGQYGGGGVFAGFSDVTIDRSRLDDNHGSFGGAITGFTLNGLDPSFLVRNSTLDDNGALKADGGAIDLPSNHSGAMQAQSDTFVGNAAAGHGDDIAGTPSAVLMHNSVLGRAPTGACAGVVVSSQGHNVATDQSCGLGSVGDRQSLDPRLGPVADNGGSTFTALPDANSPLLGAADPVGCPPSDQRGVSRPQGAGCDIGAVERRPNESPGSGTPGGGTPGGGTPSGGTPGAPGHGGTPALSDRGAIAIAHYGAAEIWLQRVAGRVRLVFTAGRRVAARIVPISVPAPARSIAPNRREHLALGLDGRGRVTAVLQGARGLLWTPLSSRPSLHKIRGTDGRDTFPSLFRGALADSRVVPRGGSAVLIRQLDGGRTRTVWRGRRGGPVARDTAIGSGRAVAFITVAGRRYALVLARPGRRPKRLLGVQLGRRQRGRVGIDRVSPDGRHVTVFSQLGRRIRSKAFRLPSG